MNGQHAHTYTHHTRTSPCTFNAPVFLLLLSHVVGENMAVAACRATRISLFFSKHRIFNNDPETFPSLLFPCYPSRVRVFNTNRFLRRVDYTVSLLRYYPFRHKIPACNRTTRRTKTLSRTRLLKLL